VNPFVKLLLLMHGTLLSLAVDRYSIPADVFS